MTKKMLALRSLIYTLAIIGFAFRSGVAMAGSLTISGQPQLAATLNADSVSLKGNYVISNSGDETARNVFLSLELGGWSWASDKQTINSAEKHSFAINEKIPLTQLNCSSDLCKNMNLPATGYFPLVIRRYYEDTNGYKFSAGDVTGIVVRDLQKKDFPLVKVPSIDGMSKLSGNGQSFKGEVEARNFSTAEKKLLVTYHTSHNLNILSKPSILTIDPGQSKSVDISIKNYNGLPGSSYAFFSILQWEELGIRNFTVISNLINVKEAPKAPWLLYGIALSLILAVILVYVFIYRKS